MTELEHISRSIARGQSFFLHDVRAALERESVRTLSLRCVFAGDAAAVRNVPLGEAPATAAGEALLRRYIFANIYNLITALGPTELVCAVPAGCGGLLSHVPGALGLSLPPERRSGPGKCVTVAQRMSLARGGDGRFSFSAEERPPFPPAEPAFAAGGAPLPPPSAAHHCALGVDVGGTDIKLAACMGEELLFCREADWDPESFTGAEEYIRPLEELTGEMLRELERRAGRRLAGFDAIGLSFPDVISAGHIAGGETAKTAGIRRAHPDDYPRELSKLSGLNRRLETYLAPGGALGMINDGSMAAYTRWLCGGGEGVLAHSLGTDIGTGWVNAAGEAPDIPLEAYQLQVLLSSAADYPCGDIRSAVSELSGLSGTLHSLVNQRGVFRQAALRLPGTEMELWDELLRGGLFRFDGETLTVPAGARKPLLERLMELAAQEDAAARELFIQTGRYLGAAWRETDFLLQPGTKKRPLFGRMVKEPRCFELLRLGAAETAPEAVFLPPESGGDEPALLRRLGEDGDFTPAQFAQAVGAIYYGIGRLATALGPFPTNGDGNGAL